MRRTLRIKNKLGLHARAAAQLVSLASGFKSEVTILKDGESVNGKSIMGLMMLAAGLGSKLRFSAKGKDSAALLGEMEGLFARKFDES